MVFVRQLTRAHPAPHFLRDRGPVFTPTWLAPRSLDIHRQRNGGATHGSAPDIAGQGVANPLALLMSAVMMLNHLAEPRGDGKCKASAERIKAAYDAALQEGQKTRDLGGELGTDEFADAVISRLDQAS